MSTIFISGANRGLGLEFVRQCLDRGDHVFAGARHPDSADQLHSLVGQTKGLLTILALDVTNQASIEQARDTIEHSVSSLDILINNAGVNEDSGDADDRAKHTRLGSLSAPHMLNMLHVNTVAPLMLAQEMVPLLKESKRGVIASISSQLASITHAGGHYYSYGTSKAGLNMAMKTLAMDLRSTGIISVMLDPGWVQTDMGGASAPVVAEDSVAGMLSILDRLTLNDTGRFLKWKDGSDVPW